MTNESRPALSLMVLPGTLAICRLDGDAPVPSWASADGIVSLTRTTDELSLVCPQDGVPAGVRCEAGWRCLRVAGQLDLSLVGVLAALTRPWPKPASACSPSRLLRRITYS